MTYLDLINSFWKAAEFNKWSANDIMVYLFLLHNCNIRRWSNPFELPTSVIENRFSPDFVIASP